MFSSLLFYYKELTIPKFYDIIFLSHKTEYQQGISLFFIGSLFLCKINLNEFGKNANSTRIYFAQRFLYADLVLCDNNRSLHFSCVRLRLCALFIFYDSIDKLKGLCYNIDATYNYISHNEGNTI